MVIFPGQEGVNPKIAFLARLYLGAVKTVRSENCVRALRSRVQSAAKFSAFYVAYARSYAPLKNAKMVKI